MGIRELVGRLWQGMSRDRWQFRLTGTEVPVFGTAETVMKCASKLYRMTSGRRELLHFYDCIGEPSVSIGSGTKFWPFYDCGEIVGAPLGCPLK